MMKVLRLAVLIIAVVMLANPTQAQRLIKKELKTENREEDGFQYQWKMYTYVLGKDTLDAAFDLNGKRITPNGYRRGDVGCWYVGGGVFSIELKKKNFFGGPSMVGYNVQGDCVFSATNRDYFFIYYEGDGLFMLNSVNGFGKSESGLYDYLGNCIIPESKGFWDFSVRNEYGLVVCHKKSGDDVEIEGVYDKKGNCIISEELGYTSIYYREDVELFSCSKKDLHGDEKEYTYSKDGNYYAEGYYMKYEKEEFEKNKRPVPNRKSNNNPVISSPTSSTASPSKSKAEEGLLYEGDYTEGPWINPNTGFSQPSPNPHHHIKIYDDRIVVDMLNLPFNGYSMNGEKTYVNTWGNVTYYVDNNFNIRGSFQYGYFQLTKGNVTFDMNVPMQGDYSGENGKNDRGSSSQKQSYDQPKRIICDQCGGTGKCVHCNGTHRISYQFGSGTVECTHCGLDGKCTKCGGSGYITN